MFLAQNFLMLHRYVVVVLEKELSKRELFWLLLLPYSSLIYALATLFFPVYLIRDAQCGYVYWTWAVREVRDCFVYLVHIVVSALIKPLDLILHTSCFGNCKETKE